MVLMFRNQIFPIPIPIPIPMHSVRPCFFPL